MISKLKLLTCLLLIFSSTLTKSEEKFDYWVTEFKIRAINEGISKKTVNLVMNNAIFLPKVIEYDRYQPEFYEDTFTYIKNIFGENFVRMNIFL